MLDIAFAKPAMPKSGALVLLIGEGEMPSGVWQQADEATGGAIDRAFKAAEFKGGKGKTCTILAPGAGLSRVVAVGLGKPAELTAHVLNEAGGHVAAAVLRERAGTVATGALQPAAGGRGGARRGAARLSLRQIPHQGKSRRTSRSSPSSRCSPPIRRAPSRHGNRCTAWRRACSSRATWSASRPTC